MAHYKAPLRDIHFVRNELIGMDDYYASTDNWNEVTSDLTNAITDECAKFCENVLQPLNRVGDQQGCTLENGVVTTPDGFKEAYQQFVEGGWPSLEGPVEFGGQALPKSLSLAVTEMVGTSNWSWGMYTGLSRGACHTITEHGTEQQKQRFLHKLLSGEWTGTMCLTEAHCGSDLGMLRTKAEPNDDGSYSITGSKIFISSGDHDFSDNIIHIVLARLPGAPEGTKGISLFIVPKVLVNDDGALADRNGVSCGSLEEKMGIHGNATCVLNFDGATGYLLGPENRGLNCMFTFMNTARIGTAIQGLAHAEFSYQNSLAYAQDRLQMRALSGPVHPDKPADPIIVHPDVRRMLLTQKAFAEGGRMLIYTISLLSDQLAQASSDEEKKQIEAQLSMLTPIAKAFMTETGTEAANLGMQIFGGHGYIQEWGMEQNVRDCRISQLYEGTTGIQALDLLGRKIMLSGGKSLKAIIIPMMNFCEENQKNRALKQYIKPLQELLEEWASLTKKIGASAMMNRDEINAACVDYLMYAGYVYYAYLYAQAAKVSHQKLSDGSDDKEFYEAKIYLAQFYYQRILPRTKSLAVTMMSGLKNLSNSKVNPF
jgi:alkylation response protein AidB-like acyl-CoA dehydrogenase